MFGPIHPALFAVSLRRDKEIDLSRKWRLLKGFAHFVVDMFGLGHRFSVISNYCQSANYTNFLAQTSHIPVQDGNLLSAAGNGSYSLWVCISSITKTFPQSF